MRLTDPAQGTTTVVNTIDVYANSEDGLQTITLDPDFEDNGWVYLYYAPRTMTAPYPATTPTGSAPNTPAGGRRPSLLEPVEGLQPAQPLQVERRDELARPASEQVIIKVEVQRGQCCHVAGDVAFDNDGNVLLATGDNTPASTPGANGYAPNNDRVGFNPGLDSRRGAGNSNDLRGKILRIDVQDDGSYTIPAGNLFAPGTEKTRPEIFVMGVRNPFRIDYDPETGAVTWGDYGPDAGTASDLRGPMGYVEWQSTTEADQRRLAVLPRTERELQRLGLRDADPGRLVRLRRHGPMNTVAPQHRPARSCPRRPHRRSGTATSRRTSRGPSSAAGGQAPMGGPTYRYDEENTSTTKFPEYWDGKAFMAEFSRDRVFAFSAGRPRRRGHEDRGLPAERLAQRRRACRPWDNVIDFEFGPDGSLYVLDYGDGFFRPNPDAGLYRVDYVEGTKGPRVDLDASVTSGQGPLEVDFSAAEQHPPRRPRAQLRLGPRGHRHLHRWCRARSATPTPRTASTRPACGSPTRADASASPRS